MAANASSQRRRSGKQATPNTGGAKRVVTLRVPVVLDENIEAYSVTSGQLKSAIIITAIRTYLTNKNLQPDKSPRLSVSY
jgi:hypothetical protein